MRTVLLFALFCLFSTNAFSQSVTLTKQKDYGVIELLGTTTVSPQMADAVKNYVKQTNKPNTFRSSIYCEFVGRRGKI